MLIHLASGGLDVIREDTGNAEEELAGKSCQASRRRMERAAVAGATLVGDAEVGFATPRMSGAKFEKLDLAAGNANTYLHQRGSELAAGNANSSL